jgi:cyclase
MLAKRIIPCLDVKNGRTVKGTNFKRLRDAGDPVGLAAIYSEQGADELVFLDISATNEERSTLISLVKRVAAEINIPFTVGGGIGKPEDIGPILDSGADKISINTAAVRNPDLIEAAARNYGSQCIVAAIDAKWTGVGWNVYLNGGRERTPLDVIQWAKQCVDNGAGEILLTSMDHDGVRDGFSLELCNAVAGAVRVPVIASGGAGTPEHFRDVFEKTPISAGLAASIFHFNEISVPELKEYLASCGIMVRNAEPC